MDQSGAFPPILHYSNSPLLPLCGLRHFPSFAILPRQHSGFDYKQRVKRLALLLALFFCCVLLYTRHNDFPFFYHPDEPDKVRQAMNGKWNFNHPLLMLGADRAAVLALGIPLDEQRVVVAGRWVSAVFSALGVSAPTLLAWRMRGPPAPGAPVILAGLHQQVFELAHYMKED